MLVRSRIKVVYLRTYILFVIDHFYFFQLPSFHFTILKRILPLFTLIFIHQYQNNYRLKNKKKKRKIILIIINKDDSRPRNENNKIPAAKEDVILFFGPFNLIKMVILHLLTIPQRTYYVIVKVIITNV